MAIAILSIFRKEFTILFNIVNIYVTFNISDQQLAYRTQMLVPSDIICPYSTKTQLWLEQLNHEQKN